MSKSNKYEIQLSDSGGAWTATVARKVSRSKILETMRKDGFDSQDSAQAWAEAEIDALLKKKNERTSEKRRLRDAENARLEAARLAREEAYENSRYGAEIEDDEA